MLEIETFTTNPELFRKKSEVLKALAHPVRLCIVQGLMTREGINVSQMQSCLDMPQSTLSQHLARLRAAGIIRGKRQGLEIHYSVISEDAKKVVTSLF